MLYHVNTGVKQLMQQLRFLLSRLWERIYGMCAMSAGYG